MNLIKDIEIFTVNRAVQVKVIELPILLVGLEGVSVTDDISGLGTEEEKLTHTFKLKLVKEVY